MSQHLRPGETFRRRGQKYRFDGLVEHRTRDGRWVDLAQVTTCCAECSHTFSFKTRRRNLRRGPLSRRCDLHKRQGVPVRPKRKPPAKLAVAEQCRRATVPAPAWLN